MNSQKIMILGVGCILFSDEGFGVRVIEKIQKNYLRLFVIWNFQITTS